jgi:hypothetical protein
VISVIADVRALSGPMFDHIGMGKAVGRVLAMAKGNHGRGCYEAERGERSKRRRQPEAEPGPESGQHGSEWSLSLLPLTYRPGTGRASGAMRPLAALRELPGLLLVRQMAPGHCFSFFS